MTRGKKNDPVLSDIVFGEDSIVGEIKIELVENLIGGNIESIIKKNS